MRRRTDADGVKLVYIALVIAAEACGGDAPIADAAFFVGAFDAQL